MLRIRRDEKEIKIGFLITGLVIILLSAYIIYLNFQFINNKNSATITKDIQSREETIIPTATVATPTINVLPTTSPIQNTAAQSKTRVHWLAG